ncbi:hypothetical protein PH5382_01041 [Phaeobacter sp. CECT 5382]|nr:hypothetical protein PH5382_01041 [Phaeobacter sp. CECT 5382]
MEQIWDSLGYNVQIGIATAPSVFAFISDRAALLIVFVARRDEIPVMQLGEDEIAEPVFKLNQKRSAWLYRILNKTCGLS